MSTLMLCLAGVLVAFEFQNVLAWWRGRTLVPAEARCADFTIIVPLFGHPRYFEQRDCLHPYQNNVLVALETSNAVMTEFADVLEAEGWSVCRLELAQPNPAALVRAALPFVATAYVLRLDADTFPSPDLAESVAVAAASGADLCSIKCAVANSVNVVTKLQALEYRMAMLARHFRPWLTSGACFLARTEALRAIMEYHSMWTPGEDIETGRVALALRMRIRHLDTVVYTDAPDRWRDLAKQRRLWWAGTFRHWWINIDKNLLHLPVLTTYYLTTIWVSVYFKWWSLVDARTFVRMLPMLFITYLIVTVISNAQVLSPWMLVFPFYAFLQVLVMPAVGAVWYFVLAKRHGRLGRYGFGYRRRRHPAAATT